LQITNTNAELERKWKLKWLARDENDVSAAEESAGKKIENVLLSRLNMFMYICIDTPLARAAAIPSGRDDKGAVLQ
jgi:hypothetical protein